ncbi:MAG: diadenylate cyclase CdaA [Spirochaetaceae bacterium]|jgi:diadenylate cyclase|nr:diadenylate cyclase CdaA [Spirochaetaceae bacterium]
MEWLQRLRGFYDYIRPVLDVAILALLIYKAYEFLVKTQALQMIKGAGFLVLVYGGAVLFKLATLRWLLSIVGPGLVVAGAIIFQPELRKIILRLGQTELFRPNAQPLGQLDAVITAAELLSQKRRGMLIVFPGRENLRHIIETGTKLNAEISSYLIVAIFEFDGPLHDGAMVIHHGRIAAAGCYLPLSEQQDIKKSFGTRHRASLGMSEQSDAVILVVSEETGAISIAFNGKLYYDLSSDYAVKKLRELMKYGDRNKNEEKDLPAADNAEKDVIIGT